MDCFSYYNNNSSSNSSITSSVETFIKHKKGNTNGKKKPTKELKLSTDPQSVAARERRHRISDRFKILQSLVPGGAKMDTVSMLDEAIHYVKFLKAQIWLHQNMMINFVDDVNVIDPSLSVSGQQGGLYSPENMVGGEVEMSPSFGLPNFYFNGGESKVFDCPTRN